MRLFIRQLRPALLVAIVVSVIFGLVYPLVVTGIGQVAFNDKADGSLIEVDGVVVGSKLLGQTFNSPQYFQSRPSAAGAGYDGSASSGSEPRTDQSRLPHVDRGTRRRLPRGERLCRTTSPCPSTQ